MYKSRVARSYRRAAASTAFLFRFSSVARHALNDAASACSHDCAGRVRGCRQVRAAKQAGTAGRSRGDHGEITGTAGRSRGDHGHSRETTRRPRARPHLLVEALAYEDQLALAGLAFCPRFVKAPFKNHVHGVKGEALFLARDGQDSLP